MIPLDTTPEVHRIQMERYRRMTGEERVLEAATMSERLAEFAASGVRQRHPHYTDEEVRLALRRMHLGDELFRTSLPGRPPTRSMTALGPLSEVVDALGQAGIDHMTSVR